MLRGRSCGLGWPVQLGVTGLARSGKTVFITALVHNLIAGGRLPFFERAAQGRIARAYLEPQPDDAVPRFAYEKHLAALIESRDWPESTRRISQLRLTIEYASTKFWKRASATPAPRHRRLSRRVAARPAAADRLRRMVGRRSRCRAGRRRGSRSPAPGMHRSSLVDPTDPGRRGGARGGAAVHRLSARRAAPHGLSLLPPGRFLMPGDLAGSPALTFAPLGRRPSADPPRCSLWAMMERRYEAYKRIVVRPFFRDHFARLDRQIVLIDALAALNGGPRAVRRPRGAP